MALSVYSDSNVIASSYTATLVDVKTSPSTPTSKTGSKGFAAPVLNNSDRLIAVYKLTPVIFNLSYISGGIEMTSYNSGVIQTWNQQ